MSHQSVGLPESGCWDAERRYCWSNTIGTHSCPVRYAVVMCRESRRNCGAAHLYLVVLDGSSCEIPVASVAVVLRWNAICYCRTPSGNFVFTARGGAAR